MAAQREQNSRFGGHSGLTREQLAKAEPFEGELRSFVPAGVPTRHAGGVRHKGSPTVIHYFTPVYPGAIHARVHAPRKNFVFSPFPLVSSVWGTILSSGSW